MADAVRIEVSLPVGQVEVALKTIFYEKCLPCEPSSIEVPRGFPLAERTMADEERASLEALKKALRLLDELETMGRVSPTGQKLAEDMPPLDKLSVVIGKIYDNEWECADQTQLSTLRDECVKRLRYFEALAATLTGQYAAILRLEVPVRNLADLEAVADAEGSMWVLRNLGVIEGRAQGTWLSRFVRSRK